MHCRESGHGIMTAFRHYQDSSLRNDNKTTSHATHRTMRKRPKKLRGRSSRPLFLLCLVSCYFFFFADFFAAFFLVAIFLFSLSIVQSSSNDLLLQLLNV